MQNAYTFVAYLWSHFYSTEFIQRNSKTSKYFRITDNKDTDILNNYLQDDPKPYNEVSIFCMSNNQLLQRGL